MWNCVRCSSQGCKALGGHHMWNAEQAKCQVLTKTMPSKPRPIAAIFCQLTSALTLGVEVRQVAQQVTQREADLAVHVGHL